MRTSRLPAILAFAVVAVFFAIWSAQKTDLFYGGLDEGRLLKNGELILSSTAPAGTAVKILHTNFYSWATSDFVYVNHHWLSGVVFFLVWKAGGFQGLSVFYILLGMFTMLISWRMAQRAAGWGVATALALAMMPILHVRASLRPEVFTGLFSGVFLWVLWEHYNGRSSWRSLFLLPALEIPWVNLHIGFIFGPVFVGAFLLDELLRRPPEGYVAGENPWRTEFYRNKGVNLGRWLGILVLTLAATLVNPSGLRGALYPLTIWGNYGMAMAENISVPTLEANHYIGEFFAIKLTLGLLYLSFFGAIVRARRFPFALLALGGLIGGMTWFAVRNQTLLGTFALAATGINAGLCEIGEVRRRWRTGAAVGLGVALLAGASYNVGRLAARKEPAGLDLKPGATDLADFLRSGNFAGPMLNNTNIGGYLTYFLYPQYRIYVDSRPEAFPEAFLQRGYQDPLMDENLWRGLLDDRQFNVLCFSVGAPWENGFVNRRMKDPEWATIYSRFPAVVLLRRSTQNQSFIQLHEIYPLGLQPRPK